MDSLNKNKSVPSENQAKQQDFKYNSPTKNKYNLMKNVQPLRSTEIINKIIEDPLNNCNFLNMDPKDTEKYNNSKQLFLKYITDDFNNYKKFSEGFISTLRHDAEKHQSINPSTNCITSAKEVQTDDYYKSQQEKIQEIENNENEIEFQTREAHILWQKLEKKKVTDKHSYGQKNINLDLFMNFGTDNKWLSPNISKIHANCIRIKPHFDRIRDSRLYMTQKPELNYLFNSITAKNDQNDMGRLITDTTKMAQDEQDSLILLYGGKTSGKRHLRNLILINQFEMFQKVLLSGAIGKSDVKLTCITKDYDNKISELWLKKGNYEKVIYNQTKALLKPSEKQNMRQRIEGCSTKCVFIELSSIVENSKLEDTSLMTTMTSKISGFYLQTCNKIVDPVHDDRLSLVRSVILESLKNTKGTPIEYPLMRLSGVYKEINAKVIVCLNPSAIASRECYEMIDNLPSQNIYKAMVELENKKKEVCDELGADRVSEYAKHYNVEQGLEERKDSRCAELIRRLEEVNEMRRLEHNIDGKI